ncbi:hypothetical protein ACOSQ4_001148 [Xanthoceras sorbifolium]
MTFTASASNNTNRKPQLLSKKKTFPNTKKLPNLWGEITSKHLRNRDQSLPNMISNGCTQTNKRNTNLNRCITIHCTTPEGGGTHTGFLHGLELDLTTFKDYSVF